MVVNYPEAYPNPAASFDKCINKQQHFKPIFVPLSDDLSPF